MRRHLHHVLTAAFFLNVKKSFCLSFLTLSLLIGAKAQYNQNFDALTSTGTGTYDNLPEGWAIFEVGTGTAADGRYAVNNGSGNGGNAYSYGVLNASDRALGTLGSGSNAPTIGAIFFNETESTISSVTLSFTMEQWRFGGNSSTRPAGTKDIIPFSYSTDATSIAGCPRHLAERCGTEPRIGDYLRYSRTQGRQPCPEPAGHFLHPHRA